VRRREFITLLGGAAAWPLSAQAQQQGDRMRRIGVLMTTAEDDVEFKGSSFRDWKRSREAICSISGAA
jgi:hypothetical protein